MTETRLIKNSISLSLVAHLFLMICAMIAIQRPSMRQKIDENTIWIEVEPIADKTKKQIVQSKAGEDAKLAKPNAFLGEKTRTVKEETIAKAQPLGQKAKPKAAEQPEQNKEQKNTQLSALGVPVLQGAKTYQPKDDPNWVQQGDDTLKDYVKGLREADETALNTKEFIFYGYFQRIRKQLDQAWGPILREKLVKMHRSGRFPASDMDHITRTLVVLNNSGEVIRVQVLEESGTRDLDQAAVKAFNDAGPFPNPPHGIIDPKGEIQIRWDFILRT